MLGDGEVGHGVMGLMVTALGSGDEGVLFSQRPQCFKRSALKLGLGTAHTRTHVHPMDADALEKHPCPESGRAATASRPSERTRYAQKPALHDFASLHEYFFIGDLRAICGGSADGLAGSI